MREKHLERCFMRVGGEIQKIDVCPRKRGGEATKREKREIAVE